jgi:hypothetical protein
MKRSITIIGVWTFAAMFTLLGTRPAKGDGGLVLLHEARGPFSVTVFVAPGSARGGLADLSVLVQWRTNGQVVLDADVSLALDPSRGSTMSQSDPVCGLPSTAAGFQFPNGTQLPMTVRATRAQASNKLLYAAPLNLSAAGACRLHVIVSRGSDYARFDCLLPVVKESPKLAGLWPYLAFPPIVMTAFALNQKLRRHSLEQKT